jgi:hypothetical protein
MRDLRMGHFCKREFYEGNLEGGLLYWGPRKICEVRLCKWASVPIGASLLGKREKRSFPRVF